MRPSVWEPSTLCLMVSAESWGKALRRDIKNEYGPGWSVSAQSGKTKLTRRYADGTRSSVMIEIPFSSGHKRELLIAIGTHAEQMAEQQISLKESRKRTAVTAANPEGVFVWDEAAKAFYETRKDLGPVTQRNTVTRIEKALDSLNRKPRPKDGLELLAAFERQHLQHLQPGSEGRKKSIQEVGKFLRFCVERRGLAGRWMPPVGEQRQELVGAAEGRDAKLTPPLKTDDFIALLSELERRRQHGLRLAVGLVGLYGLRPAELAVLSFEDGQLRVGQVKRNMAAIRKGAKQQARENLRLALPLDLPGHEGLGAQLALQWQSGLVKLPLPIRTAIKTAEKTGSYKPVGDAFRQLLDRHRFWKSLVAGNPGLTPYSLRHSFAWRAHKQYDRPLSVRDAAALMGHDPETHYKHYGRWTDEAGLLDAVSRLTAQPAKPASQAFGAIGA
ncbi:Phage integrase family protein [Synechococcus sp. RCC307]|nr:Phage integrase family protein [Synechococcus sp. RCC307]